MEICGYALTDLATAGGASSRAEGLNEHGLVAGYIRTGGRSHAVLWVNGYPMPLEPNNYPSNWQSEAYDVNALAQVVGKYQINAAGDYHAFLWLLQPACGFQQGMNDLGVLPGDQYSRAYALNDSTQVVGWSGRTGSRRAFIYLCEPSCNPPMSRGMHDLHPTNPPPHFGYAESAAVDINNCGNSAGTVRVVYYPGEMGIVWWDSMLWRCAEASSGWHIEGPDGSPSGISANGLVAGYSGSFENPGSYSQAYLCTTQSNPWSCVWLPSLGGNESAARAVNSAGQVVGYSTLPDNTRRACLWQNETPLDLNSVILWGTGCELVDATDINEHGQIVGYCRLGSEDRAVLLTPCPCPGVTKADANCDGVVNTFDIDAFVLAVTDGFNYWLQYPDCNWLCACDINCDGYVNSFDVDPFVRCLLGEDK
jgi:probable HAF family extracellular repeat protein